MKEFLKDLLTVLFYIGVLVLIMYIDTLSGYDYQFATVLTWIAIGIYCYIRFGIYGDKM